MSDMFLQYSVLCGQYLKHGGDNPVAHKKMTLGQVVTNFTGQVVTSCACVRACARARACVCVVLPHYSRIRDTSSETMHSYVYIKRKSLSFFY